MICTLHQYYSSYQIKNEMDGHVVVMEETTGAYRALVEKPEGDGTLRRHRGRQKCNIKMDLQEVKMGHRLD